MHIPERDAFDLLVELLDPAGWAVFLDIGSGAGHSVHRTLKLFPKATIHAFEPAAEDFSRLEASVARLSRVHPWRIRVGRSGAPAGGPSRVRVARLGSTGETTATLDRLDDVSTPSQSVNAWAAEHRVDHVDVINVGVPEAALELLESASHVIRACGVRAIHVELPAVSPALPIGFDSFMESLGMRPHPAPGSRGLWVRADMLDRLRAEPARAYRIDWREALLGAITTCRKAGASRIALYGAGHHTISCESIVRETPEIVALINDSRGHAGQALAGLPVLTRSEAQQLKLDAVIISSNTQEEAIWINAACFRDAGIPVHRLYPEPTSGIQPRAILRDLPIGVPLMSASTASISRSPSATATRLPNGGSLGTGDKSLRDSLLRSSVFCEHEKSFMQRLAAVGYAPDCVFDVGAASGWWSSIIAEVFPHARFELFEPLLGDNPLYDGDAAMILRSHPLFRTHATALGAENTQAQFWRDPGPGYSSSLLCERQQESQRITIPVARLDDYVAQHGLLQPQIIKVDVQGGEAEVIEGGKQAFARADVLHLETWFERCYGPRTPLLHELIEILAPLNFRIVQIGGFWRHEKRETLASVDAFFANIDFIERLREHGAGFPWPANGEY